MTGNMLININTVASKLEITEQYARKLIRDGKLKAMRVGSQWVIDDNELDRYMMSNDNISFNPSDQKRVENTIPKIVALSFFSGAMGLDIGMANAGINALLACESNKHCRRTIFRNRPDIGLIGDINMYSSEDILRMANIPNNQTIDVIFGGPPCQSFSTAGTRRGLNDNRGNVFLRYIEIVNQIKPTYVVIENVRGLLSTPYSIDKSSKPIKGGALYLIISKLRKAGYTVSFNLYNAANFGAPQIRERVVIIGKFGTDRVPYLSPTHSNNPDDGLPCWRTLHDAISNIAHLSHHYINFPEKRLKFYRMLTEGQYWKDLPADMQIEAMGDKLKLGGGKTGFYRRLSFNKPSPTLVTNPTMPATDLCHPTEDRPLSVEEYSAIQGFPLNWQICGSILEQYKQIGNAVPIKLGEAIAHTIISDMEGKKQANHAEIPIFSL